MCDTLAGVMRFAATYLHEGSQVGHASLGRKHMRVCFRDARDDSKCGVAEGDRDVG